MHLINNPKSKYRPSKYPTLTQFSLRPFYSDSRFSPAQAAARNLVRLFSCAYNPPCNLDRLHLHGNNLWTLIDFLLYCMLAPWILLRFLLSRSFFVSKPLYTLDILNCATNTPQILHRHCATPRARLYSEKKFC